MVWLQLPHRLSRRFLSFTAFLTAFSVVMILLILLMDTTGVKYYQRLNVTGDFDVFNSMYDNPQLITYIRDKYVEMPSKAVESKITNHTSTPLARLVVNLLNNRKNGLFVETYAKWGKIHTTWLETSLGWKGYLIQPDPFYYEQLHCLSRLQTGCIQACLSPTAYPKEATFKQTPDKETNFVTIKCFPLFSILLAVNATSADFLHLQADGTELQVLKTLPFEKMKIAVISVDSSPATAAAVELLMALNKYRSVGRVASSIVFVRNF